MEDSNSTQAQPPTGEEVTPQTDITLRTDIRTDTQYYSFQPMSPEAFRLFTIAEDGKCKLDKRRMVDYLGHMKIVANGSQLYIFNNRTYESISDQDAECIIESVLDQCPNPPFMSRSTRQDIIASVKARFPVSKMEIPDDFWDDPRYQSEHPLIPFQNGLYNIDRDELEPFTPYLFITHLLGAYYYPKCQEHRVEDVYRKILPDETTRETFFELVGYSVYSEAMSPPVLVTVYGPGNTGKTALQEAVTILAGRENVSNLDIGQIGNGFYTADLTDKIINISGETGSGVSGGITKSDGELLKRLSDGQAVKVQRKYGQPFDLFNRAKLWFVTNTIPDFGDTSSGLQRRLRIIPCRVEQRWEDQIYTTMQEDSAISWLANKTLIAYLRFLKRGRRFSQSEEMTTEAVSFTTQEPVMDFLESYCGTLSPPLVAKFLDGRFIRDVYDEYSMFTVDSGGRPMSMRKFSERIRNEFRLTSETIRGTQPNGKPTSIRLFSASSWRF